MDAKYATIARKRCSGWSSKLTNDVVEGQMHSDNDTTAVQLHEFLSCHGIALFLCRVLENKELLDWTFQGSSYCQMLTSSSDWSGHVSILMITLKMSSGQARRPFNLKCTKDVATES